MQTEEERLLEELYIRDKRSEFTYSDMSIKIPSTPTDYPDAKKHQLVSFIKSGIRILGYVLIPFNLFWAASILILSEVVGIVEELV